MAQQANLPWPIGFMSIGNRIPIPPNIQCRSRLMRFLQDLRELERPKDRDMTDALNFYTGKTGIQTTAGVHAYTHFKVINIPRQNQAWAPGSLHVRIPRVVARDISLPWILLSNMNQRPSGNAFNHIPKYRFMFFIYRHKPTMRYDPNNAGNRRAPNILYSVSYWDRENPGQMVWLDFKDHPPAHQAMRLVDVQRFWHSATLDPQGSPVNWFVDPNWYNNVLGHPWTQFGSEHPAYSNLELWADTRWLRQYTCYFVMSFIVYCINNIYCPQGVAPGVPTPTRMPETHVEQMTGMASRILPELFVSIVHILRVQPNHPFSGAIVRGGAHLPMPNPAGGPQMFGLLNPTWVQTWIGVSRDAEDRIWRRRVKAALLRIPNRVVAAGVGPQIDEFPNWYLNSLV